MIKNVYDKIYSVNLDYNFHYPPKDLMVDLYAQMVGGKILDAGCGQGIHLRRLLENGVDAFGVEMSEVCCQKYLYDLPHENSDICSFAAQSDQQFDGIVCFDVLEHIPVELINKTIESLATLAPSALLGLANHSDIQCGEELHLVQEDIEWWIRKLSPYYSAVYPIVTYFGGRFFCVEVSERATVDQLKSKWCGRNSSAIQLANSFDVYWNKSQLVAEQHQALQTEHQALQTEHQALQTEHQALQTEHQALQSKYQMLQTDHQALQTDHQALQTDHQALQTDHQALQTDHQALQTDHQALQTDHQALQSKYQMLLTSKAVRLSNKLKRMIGKQVAE